ncbi:MAG: hypothetical protein RLZ92_413 [Pseudomonadota bacterium]
MAKQYLIELPSTMSAQSWKKKSCVLALGLGSGLMISGCSSLSGLSQNQSNDNQLNQQLLQKMAERDQMIEKLMNRLEKLEKTQIAAVSPTASTVTTTGSAPMPVTPAKPDTPKPQTGNGKPTMSNFEVDEDAAQRALERTLVQTGALLLPSGQAEIQPFMNYSRRESKEPFLYLDNSDLLTANANIRRNDLDMGANLLVGLPFEAQAELRLPYKLANQSVVGSNGITANAITHDASGLSNINVGLAKTLLHEKGWQPDLIGRVAWDIPSGDFSSNGIAMGGGFSSVNASITALKRQDPLAFTARIGYQKTFKKYGIEPGDQVSLAIGTNLAASPKTSLSLGLQQTYSMESKINQVTLPGSNTLASAFTVGASSTIGRNFFFSVLGGIGLTDTSPKYFLNLTIPFRFDVPYVSKK